MNAFTIRSRRAAITLATGALALGGGAGATVLAPVAQADTTLNVVRAHVRSADAALHKVESAALGGSLGGSLVGLEAQIRAAGLNSAKLYKLAHHAHNAATSGLAASAMTKLAGQQSRDATALTPLVGQLTGAGQSELASFVAAVTQGREEALTLATQLLGQLSLPAKTQIAGTVAQLSDAGTGQAGLLASSISPGSIACPAIQAIGSVIAAVLASVQADLARVQSMVALLPTGSTAQFSGILAGLPAQLNSLLATIAQAFNCASTTPVITTPTTAPTGSGAGSLGTTGLGGTVGSLLSTIIAFIEQLLSSFLPGISSGQTPSPVTFGASSGLSGPWMSFIPNFASLFGGGSGGSGTFGG